MTDGEDCLNMAGGTLRQFLSFWLMLAFPADSAGQLWNGTACGSFEVSNFRSGYDRVAKKDQVHGQGGGSWSACTHLHEYGMQTAPVFMRLMAFALRPKSVLEIGSGLGLFSDYLARFIPGGAHVTCIEPEPMLAEVFGLRNLPLRPSQLSINLFNDDARPCREALTKQPFDLVYSFEVAEHIPSDLHPNLVDTIVAATGRFLLFSAAMPHQAGTGHLPKSQLTKRAWVDIFSRKGLVLLPNLSALVSQSTWPERGPDIGINVFVMRAQDVHVDDDQIVSDIMSMPVMQRDLLHPLRKEVPLSAWRINRPEQEIDHSGVVSSWKQMQQASQYDMAHFHAALWPELFSLQELLKRCPRSANARGRAKYCC